MLIQCRLIYDRHTKAPLIIVDSLLVIGNEQLFHPAKLHDLAKQLTSIADEAEQKEHLYFQYTERSYPSYE